MLKKNSLLCLQFLQILRLFCLNGNEVICLKVCPFYPRCLFFILLFAFTDFDNVILRLLWFFFCSFVLFFSGTSFAVDIFNAPVVTVVIVIAAHVVVVVVALGYPFIFRPSKKLNIDGC